MSKKRPERVYYYRGLIERGADYRWTEGYSRSGSNGEIWFPWMTRRECQSEARKEGYIAVFYREGKRLV